MSCIYSYFNASWYECPIDAFTPLGKIAIRPSVAMCWIELMRRPIVNARKTFSAFHFALFAFFVLSLFGSPAYGQRKNKNETIQHPDGLVQDWSHHHAVYPRIGPLQNLLAVQKKPRGHHSLPTAARTTRHPPNNPT